MYFDRGWHEPNFYTIYDTLNNYGVNIDFNDSIYWENVSNYDAIWIFEPKVFTNPPQLCITFDEIEVLKKFIKFGGNIFIGDSRNSVSADDDSLIPRPLPYNILFRLLGTSMSKKIVYPGFVPDVSCNIFFNFPPFTNDIDSIILQAPASIECGNDCYPFVFLADTFYYRDTVLFDTPYDTIIVSAISYPFIKENNCSSFVIFVSGIHDWEGREILPADNLSFAKNVLLTCIRYHGYDFSPCQVPEPYKIEVDSIFPSRACPYDVIRIYGKNLWRGKTESLGGDIEIYIGAIEMVPQECDTIVIPIRYSPDSTWLEFVMPDLPPGTYPIRLGHKAVTFYGGEITILPCPHRCERFPNPITPNLDAINDFAQFEFDGIFVKPAQIHIFDIHGHEIRTIDIPTGLSAKQHARWNGTDDGGNPVPEGVYIYTIEVAGEIVCEGTVTVAR